MIDRRLALPMAALGLVLVEGLAVALALVAPDKLRTALVAGLALPALWACAELFRGDKTQPRFAIAVAALLLAVPLGTHLARAIGWIEAADADLSSRLFGIAGGLILAVYGNFIPRQLDRYDPGNDRSGPAAAAAAPGRMGLRAGWPGLRRHLGAAAGQDGGDLVDRPDRTCRCCWCCR